MKDAQEILRHSDPRLTSTTYTHLTIRDLSRATDDLRHYSLPPPDDERMKATGTFDIDKSLSKSCHDVDTRR